MTDQQQQQPPLPLDLPEYEAYGRQMLVPQVGLPGQLALKSARVLVVGAGGLGSPALAYLAGAGVGTIGIVDGDTVARSNLHRQIIHTAAAAEAGELKVESARRYIRELNPGVRVRTYATHALPTNIFSILGPAEPEGKAQYDLVLDCTDNPATRYLINDAAVLCKVPLVSASALRTEGQLAVLNFQGGPCYRCLFPVPPPASTVTACGDGGILGPVVGLMGVWQAVEAIKVLTEAYTTGGEAPGAAQEFRPSLHLFAAYGFPPFRAMKMRGRKPSCAACGDHPSTATPAITREAIESGDLDYKLFCGEPAVVRLDRHERVDPQTYKSAVVDKALPHTLLDVRAKEQYSICALPNSVNIPYSKLTASTGGGKGTKEVDLGELREPIYVVCRYGNDSQGSVRALKERGYEQVWDITGGLNQWSLDVDPTFPRY